MKLKKEGRLGGQVFCSFLSLARDREESGVGCFALCGVACRRGSRRNSLFV